jgi:hypothetical protein
VGHVFAATGAIEGVDPKESIAGVESAMRRLVVELFPKIRFGRAELFFFSKGLVCTNIQVLPLHTASPSPHASARKHAMQPERQNRNNFEVIVGRAHS